MRVSRGYHEVLLSEYEECNPLNFDVYDGHVHRWVPGRPVVAPGEEERLLVSKKLSVCKRYYRRFSNKTERPGAFGQRGSPPGFEIAAEICNQTRFRRAALAAHRLPFLASNARTSCQTYDH